MVCVLGAALVMHFLGAQPEVANWDTELQTLEQQDWCDDPMRTAIRGVRRQMTDLESHVPENAFRSIETMCAGQLKAIQVSALGMRSKRYRSATCAHSLLMLAYQLSTMKAVGRWPSVAERKEISERYEHLKKRFRQLAGESNDRVHPDAMLEVIKAADAAVAMLLSRVSEASYHYLPSETDITELERMFSQASRGLVEYYEEVGVENYSKRDWSFAVSAGNDLSMAMRDYMREVAAAGGMMEKAPVDDYGIAGYAELGEQLRKEIEETEPLEYEAQEAAWNELQRQNEERASPEALKQFQKEMDEKFLRTHGPPPRE